MLELISLLLTCIWTININQCVDIINQITEYEYTAELNIEEEVEEVEEVEEDTRIITHLWYDRYDIIQDYVEYAYILWWIDFVKVIECENWRWDMYRWSNTNDYWLCQVNIPSHNVPEWFYDDAYIQLDYCYELWKWWTPFYWPNRIIKWQRCSDYVDDRFLIFSDNIVD